MSLIKGARNPESAKKFYDWALTTDVQSRSLEVKAYQVMSNRAAKSSPNAPKLDQIKLIDYDFKKYGSSAERKRLLKKWDDEVKSLPN
jgi:iron(III) transport system substrate-binding protein